MGTSIAWPLTDLHKRQPGFGKTQRARAHAGRNSGQRVTRLDLRLPPPLDKRARLTAGGGSLSPQHLEAVTVDRLERLRPLKSRVSCRVEFAGTFDRALAVQLSAVALEAKGSRWRAPPLAGQATSFRASAFQLAAWKANPLSITIFRETIRQGPARDWDRLHHESESTARA